MAIILLTLLAFSVTITIVGVLLSPIFQVSQERDVSPTFRSRKNHYREPKAMPVPARARRADGVVPSRQRAQRQSSARMFPTTGSSPLDSSNIFSFPGRSTTTQVPWLGIALMLLALSVLGIYALRIFLPNSAQLIAISWIDGAGPAKAPAMKNTRSQKFPGVLGASQALVRLS